MNWGRVVRNVFSNWTSYLVTAVIAFMLTPVVVHSLGATGYGLWTLVLSITGYFGLLDLGIRSSVSRFLARHLALNDDEAVNRTASAAFLMLACGGVIAFLATLGIAAFFFDSFLVEPEYASAGRTALLITGLNMSCVLPLGIFSAMLYASERFDIVSGITIVMELARGALVVWLLRNNYGLVALAVVALGISALQYGAMAVFARRLHPRLRINLRQVDWAVGRELFGFSIYRFVWIVANQLIFYVDAVVIGIYLGAGAITHFAIAASLVNYGRNVVFLLLDPLYPSAARMDADGDVVELQRLLIVGTRLALLVALPLCVGFMFLGRQFITLWMGSEYVGSAVVLMVLTIPQFGSMPQYVSALVLAGMARHKVFAYVALAEGIANVVLSVYLVQRIGLIGVAWGTVIPALLTNFVVVPLYTLHVLKIDLKDYLVKAYLRPVLCALPVVAMAYSYSMLETTTWLRFAAEAISICGVFGVMSYFLCLYAEQRAALTARLWAVVRSAPATSEV
ncbi:MAG: oligosaccharide flippase family protein [Vicinamibacterales bacterium]